jgi:TolB protein
MKKNMRITLLATSLLALALMAQAQAQTKIVVPGESKPLDPGNEKPVLVSLTGFAGEAAQVIQFDLYVQGFAFTNAEAAQYQITGSDNGNLQARAIDRFNKNVLVSKAYSGSNLRSQAHWFADDFVQALGRIPIAKTKIAFKAGNGSTEEIYVSDFDGHQPQPVTRDGAIVSAPCWVPHHLALFYCSYKLNHPDIYLHNLAAGTRRPIARYGGSNMSPAASPDGSKVAMILSKDGWVDLYVANADGSDLLRLTHSPQDESSPCWSPDGKWICFAGKQEREHRGLYKIPASGGAIQRISTAGVSSPTEPDWSPDSKWIAFSSQYGGGFTVCVVPAAGGTALSLVEGEDPSWSPNSRTLVFARRVGGKGNYVLSLLDTGTKQAKDVSRISGISSQSQPSWAK